MAFDQQGARGLFTEPTAKIEAFSAGNLEVRFVADLKSDDGRFANNGGLQECPHPITKISWDNAISISPKLAKELDIYPHGSRLQIARVELADDLNGRELAHVGEVTINGRTVRGPLHIQPGLSNYTILLPLGYGRTKSGHIGTNAGFSAYAVRTAGGMHVASGAKITLTGDRMPLANTQSHWSMEGRDLVREANLEEYRENPAFVKEIGMESETPSNLGEEGEKLSPAQRATEIPRGNSLYQTPQKGHGGFDGFHQWGMSIDLNTCVGCNACVVACQAENNIPIVGKDQSLR